MLKPTERHRNLRIAGLLLLSLLVVAGCGKSKTPEEYTQDALAHRKGGDIAAAIIDLKNALQKDNKNAAARRLLGEYYLELPDANAAETELLRARQDGADPLSVAKSLAEAELLLGKSDMALKEAAIAEGMPADMKAGLRAVQGRALLALGRRAEALDAFAAGLRDDPRSPDVLGALVRYELNSGDLETAKSRLAELQKDDGASAVYFGLRGAVMFAAGDFAESEKAYGQMLAAARWNLSARLGVARAQVAEGKLKEAEATLAVVLKASPNDANANYLRALTAYRQADYHLAQARVERALTAAPDFPPAILLAGATNYALKQYEQASHYLGDYVRRVPGNAEAKKLLAAVQLALGHSGDAVKTLSTMAEKTDDAQLLAMIGTASAQAGDLSGADRYFGEALKRRPEDVDLRAQRGITELALGHTEAGIEELEQAVRQDPTALRAEIALFVTYLRDSQYDKALGVGARLRNSRPTEPIGFDFTGLVQMAKGDVERARTDFDKARQLRPGDPIACRSLAGLAVRDGKIPLAIQYNEEIVAANPKDMRAQVDLATLYLQDRRAEKAYATLEQAIRQNPDDPTPRAAIGRLQLSEGKNREALESVDAMLAAHPKDAGLLEIEGRAQLALGRNEAAIVSFSTLVGVVPKAAASHILLAEAYLASGNADSAQAEANRAVQLEPANFAANATLVRTYVAKKNYDAAVKLLDDLAGKAPKDANVADLKGGVEMARGRADGAVAAYRQAIAIADTATHRIHLAAAQAKAGQADAATATLTDWLQAHPGDVAVMLALGDNYLQQARNGEAIAQYQAVLRQMPDNVVAENNVAWVLSLDGKAEDALAHARHAATLAPNAPQILDTYGVVLLQSKRSDEAVDTLTKAAQLAPAAAEIQFHLAQALVGAGNKPKARDVLRSLLASNQSFADRNRAQKLFEELGG